MTETPHPHVPSELTLTGTHLEAGACNCATPHHSPFKVEETEARTGGAGPWALIVWS